MHIFLLQGHKVCQKYAISLCENILLFSLTSKYIFLFVRQNLDHVLFFWEVEILVICTNKQSLFNIIKIIAIYKCTLDYVNTGLHTWTPRAGYTKVG
jgi:hypothetical protein